MCVIDQPHVIFMLGAGYSWMILNRYTFQGIRFSKPGWKTIKQKICHHNFISKRLQLTLVLLNRCIHGKNGDK